MLTPAYLTANTLFSDPHLLGGINRDVLNAVLKCWTQARAVAWETFYSWPEPTKFTGMSNLPSLDNSAGSV